MVHRRIALLGVAVVATAVLVASLPAAADAANRRIAISNYQWSESELAIDRGEHVTWYWIGPDTMHSVTGLPPEAEGLDSDPQTNQPQHRIGDTFELDFDQPGTYTFQCKLHSTVRGTVEVSAQPGDPDSEPDPVPESPVDLAPPKLTGVGLGNTTVGRKGTPLRYSLSEPARLEADYYRLRPGRSRRFTGYAGWKGGHIGFNSVRFGTRRKHFKPKKPGRYIAEIRAIDRAGNVTRPQRLRFKLVR